jgi:hypothetical protein
MRAVTISVTTKAARPMAATAMCERRKCVRSPLSRGRSETSAKASLSNAPAGSGGILFPQAVEVEHNTQCRSIKAPPSDARCPVRKDHQKARLGTPMWVTHGDMIPGIGTGFNPAPLKT